MKNMLTLLLFILASTAFGISINGKVTSSNGDAPIPNALITTVSSFGKTDSTYADSLGAFKLSLLSKRSYRITAQSSLTTVVNLKAELKYQNSKPTIINLMRLYTAPKFVHLKLKPVPIKTID